MWDGNYLGDDPTILSGSPLDPADPAGYLFGNRIGELEAPVPDDDPVVIPESDPLLIEGQWVPADDVRAIIAGDPVSGTYVIGGTVYTP